MDEGGERENGVRSDLSSDSRIKFQFRSLGAHPWIPGRCHSLAHSISNRLAADARRSGKQSPP